MSLGILPTSYLHTNMSVFIAFYFAENSWLSRRTQRDGNRLLTWEEPESEELGSEV